MAGMKRALTQWSPKRECRKFPMLHAWVLFLVFLAINGCSTMPSSGLLPFPSEQGGIPAAQVLEVSDIVARMRSEYPDLSATAVPYEGRHFGKAYASPEPVLALAGKGRAISSEEHVAVRLYLDKASYTAGYVEVAWDGGTPEVLPIVAFDNKGRPDGVFDYIYLLTRDDGGMYYLDLVGGEYGGMNVKYVGFEGTLIVPGPGPSLRNGTKVYKLDFGFRFPLPPEFAAHVGKAGDLAGSLSKGSRSLLSRKAELERTQEELLGLRNTPPAEDKAAAQEKKIQALEARVTTLKAGISSDTDLLESAFSEYFVLRQTISDSYADFISSNYYTWMPPGDQLDYWKEWRKMQGYDEKVEEAYQPFLDFAGNPDRLREDRKQALRTIEKNDIKSRDPLKK